MEHFHGDDDVALGVNTLLKNHVRQVCGVNLEPRQRRLATIRHFNQGTGYGSSAYPKKTSQAMRNELGPRWSTCSSTSRNRVTHLFAT